MKRPSWKLLDSLVEAEITNRIVTYIDEYRGLMKEISDNKKHHWLIKLAETNTDEGKETRMKMTFEAAVRAQPKLNVSPDEHALLQNKYESIVMAVPLETAGDMRKHASMVLNAGPESASAAFNLYLKYYINRSFEREDAAKDQKPPKKE